MGFETLALTALGLGAAGGGLGAYSSFEQARQANRYSRQQQKAQTRAAQIQARQIEAQAALEKEKTAREAHHIRQTLRVAAGASGLGLGGTYEALVRQADYDQALNEEIIQRNAGMAIESAYSQISPRPPVQNALLGALIGGLGGMGTGLSIGASGMALRQYMTTPPSTQAQLAPLQGSAQGVHVW